MGEWVKAWMIWKRSCEHPETPVKEGWYSQSRIPHRRIRISTKTWDVHPPMPWYISCQAQASRGGQGYAKDREERTAHSSQWWSQPLILGDSVSWDPGHYPGIQTSLRQYASSPPSIPFSGPQTSCISILCKLWEKPIPGLIPSTTESWILGMGAQKSVLSLPPENSDSCSSLWTKAEIDIEMATKCCSFHLFRKDIKRKKKKTPYYLDSPSLHKMNDILTF